MDIYSTLMDMERAWSTTTIKHRELAWALCWLTGFSKMDKVITINCLGGIK